MRLGVTSGLVREVSGRGGLGIDELGVPLVEVYLDEVPALIGTSVDWSLVRDLGGLGGVDFTVHAPTGTGKFSSIDLGRRSSSTPGSWRGSFRLPRR